MKKTTTSSLRQKPKRSRPGVHAKTKNSVHKTGKHYQKKSRGQGK